MKAIVEILQQSNFVVHWTYPKYNRCMWNCVNIFYAFLELYEYLIIENILQNFNDRYFNKSYVTNNQCDMF